MTLPIVERLRLRFRHAAYLATDARLSADPDCAEAADTIEGLADLLRQATDSLEDLGHSDVAGQYRKASAKLGAGK